MRVLITGGAGFIGKHLHRELEGHGHDVFALDQNPAPGVNMTYDLRADGVAARWIARANPDVVVHLAAQVGRLFGEDDLEHTVSSNVLMTARVAKACGEAGARLVYASTSEVYGDQGVLSCSEDGPTVLPHNLYGVTKYQGEQVAALYATAGLQVLRLSMPFGPGLPAGRGRAAIVNFLYNALHGLEVPVHDGASRCWCWVGDTVRGIRLIIEQGEVAAAASDWMEGVGVYNVGRDDNEASMLDVARLACELTGGDEDLIRVVPAPAAQTVVKRLATGKLQSLGWAPTIELREGMERTLSEVATLPAPERLAA